MRVKPIEPSAVSPASENRSINPVHLPVRYANVIGVLARLWRCIVPAGSNPIHLDNAHDDMTTKALSEPTRIYDQHIADSTTSETVESRC